MARKSSALTTDALLLRVWREACRHIEITEFTNIIAVLLAEHLPLRRVIVRRANLGQSCVETVAVAMTGKATAPPRTPSRADLTAAQSRCFVAWCAEGAVLHAGRRRVPDDLAWIIPGDVRADVLLGPLRESEGPVGVLLLEAREGEQFLERHLHLMKSLLEPFAAALENDRRLHEMTRLREAAEADRRALLTRLGRTDINNEIVGSTSGLRSAMERVALVAPSDAPVLLLGETGTGKEVIARAIHVHAPRAGGPFIRVNCGAIPPELLDSQLFGHERGSFTGAVDQRKGWFERADGGTLFLDEVGELPLAAQVRLLRVLQDGYIERVGAQQSIHVDVRIIGATNRDLAALVREKRFREDLWYRIAVFPIQLPPLRDRPEDIAALARHFAEKAATRFGLAPVMPTPDDVRVLLGYAWPGNVRELASVIDRAALLGNGRRLEVVKALGVAPYERESGRIGAADLGAAGVDAPESGAGAAPAGPVRAEARTPVERQPAADTLDDAMRRHIEDALRATHGRIEGVFGAAARLNINPHTLRARMRKLGVDWRAFRSTARRAPARRRGKVTRSGSAQA